LWVEGFDRGTVEQVCAGAAVKFAEGWDHTGVDEAEHLSPPDAEDVCDFAGGDRECVRVWHVPIMHDSWLFVQPWHCGRVAVNAKESPRPSREGQAGAS